MKKIFSLLIAAVLLALITIPAFAQNTEMLVDNAGLFTEQEREELSELLLKASDELNFDIVFLTVDDAGADIQAFADDYYDYNGYGRGSKYDGCILVISMADKAVWFSGCGSAEKYFTSSRIDDVIEGVTPFLSDGNYAGAVNKYISTVKKAIASSEKAPVKAGIISFIIGLVVSAIATLCVKKSYSPVAFKRSASDYLDNGSLNIKGSYDRFLYNRVTSVRIQSESSSSSGGSHTSSSGRSHVGGGGHF